MHTYAKNAFRTIIIANRTLLLVSGAVLSSITVLSSELTANDDVQYS